MQNPKAKSILVEFFRDTATDEEKDEMGWYGFGEDSADYILKQFSDAGLRIQPIADETSVLVPVEDIRTWMDIAAGCSVWGAYPVRVRAFAPSETLFEWLKSLVKPLDK